VRRFRNLFRQSDFCFLLFLLGFVLLNWPFLKIFQLQRSGTAFISLFLFWSIAVFLLWLIGKSCREAPSDEDQERDTDNP
jgi:hypothetical protein